MWDPFSCGVWDLVPWPGHWEHGVLDHQESPSKCFKCSELWASWKVKVLVAQPRLTLCDPMNPSRQAPLSMQFPRQEYWSGLPFPSPGALPDPGIELRSPVLQADSLLSKQPGNTLSSLVSNCCCNKWLKTWRLKTTYHYLKINLTVCE